MKDPYSVLGLERGASPEELRQKYESLRAVYSEQRFKPGEEGNEGAEKLQELEEAWVFISADIDNNSAKEKFGGDYGQVDALIRQGKYNEAQDILDSISDRNGEWHYMQAIVFYKREWLTESRTQLEMALQDDPKNTKYRASLDKLNLAIAHPETAFEQAGQSAPIQGDTQQAPVNQADNMSNCLSSCCCAYCLTDLLCSTLRCC